MFQMMRMGQRYGNWPPTTTPAEVQSFKWINENLPEDAIFFTNWFTGDFIRSYCQREFIITSYLRANIRSTQKDNNLDIPVPKTASEIIEYVEKNKEKGNYYIFKSKFGPSFDFDRNPAFKQIAIFNLQTGIKEQVMISSLVSF